MKKLTERFPKIKEANNVVLTALLAFAVLIPINFFISPLIYDVRPNWSIYLGIMAVILSLLFGNYMRYRWAEVLTLLCSTAVLLGSFFAIISIFEESDLSFLLFIKLIIPMLFTIISLVISLLLFIIRFNRSKQMTDDFVNYS